MHRYQLLQLSFTLLLLNFDLSSFRSWSIRKQEWLFVNITVECFDLGRTSDVRRARGRRKPCIKLSTHLSITPCSIRTDSFPSTRRVYS